MNATRTLAKGLLAKVSLAVTLGLQAAPSLHAQDIRAKIDEYLDSATALGRFSGSVLVARAGTVILSEGYGLANIELGVPNTPRTKHRIGSVTKPFTAAAIMLLQQRGRLSARDPLCKYFADCPAAWRDITIHHLMSHTSGIPNYTGFPDYISEMREPTTVEALIGRFRDKPLDFAPGAEYRYSNSGYILLGEIILRVAGVGFGQFVQTNFFVPLGMTATGYDIPMRVIKDRASGYSRSNDIVINAPYIATSTVHSAGALFSTVEDLYRWDQALQGTQLFTKATLDSTFTVVKGGYGYGWGIGTQFNRRQMGHNGQLNGFTAVMSRFPEERVSIIVLTNSDQTVPSVDRVARDLAAIVFGEPYELPRKLPVFAMDPSLLDAYVGEYELAPKYILTVTRAGNRLTAVLTGGPPLELRAVSETTFSADVVDAQFSFVRGAGGAVTHVVLKQAGEQQARKIR